MRNYLDPHNMDVSRTLSQIFDWTNKADVCAVCEEIRKVDAEAEDKADDRPSDTDFFRTST